METKKCPFCGEEVFAEAIKCKHCGERFDTVEFEGITFIQKNKNKELIYQDFDKIKLYFGVYVASSLIAMIFSIFHKTYFLAEIVSTSLWVWFMLFLKTYLQNFQRIKFNLLLSTLIIIYVISQIILTLSEKFGEEDSVMAIALLLLISWLVIFIIIGIRLKKLASFDFIGKMKQFGNSIIIFIPISLILTLIGTALKEDGELLILSYFFLLIGYIATIYPFVIMVQMFMLAKEHQESEATITENSIQETDNSIEDSENIEPKVKKTIIITSIIFVFIIIVGGFIYFNSLNQDQSKKVEILNDTQNTDTEIQDNLVQSKNTNNTDENLSNKENNLPKDFLDFLKEFTTNKSTQIALIQFPLLDSYSSKISDKYNAKNWVFFEKKWVFDGIKNFDGTKYIGSFYVKNTNEINYELGIPESDIICLMGFNKINSKWKLVDFFEPNLNSEE